MSSIEIEMNVQHKARRSQTTAVGKVTLNLTETQFNGKFSDVPLSTVGTCWEIRQQLKVLHPV